MRLERTIDDARRSRSFRIFDLDPGFRRCRRCEGRDVVEPERSRHEHASIESGNHPNYKAKITEAKFSDLVETTLFDRQANARLSESASMYV